MLQKLQRFRTAYSGIATLLKNNTATINILIDTGCLQTNVVCARIAALLRQDEKILRKAGVQLVSGDGGVTYGVEGMMDAGFVKVHDIKDS